MRPNNVDGKQWSADTSNLALGEIRTQVIADLNGRDERMSGGRMNAANRYAPSEEIKTEREVHREDGKGDSERVKSIEIRTKINPVLAEIKHTGVDTQALLKKRWADFCANPQDEKPYRHQLDQVRREEQIEIMRSDGEGVEQSLATVAVGVAVNVAVAEPPKRGVGRPAGSKNRPKIEV